MNIDYHSRLKEVRLKFNKKIVILLILAISFEIQFYPAPVYANEAVKALDYTLTSTLIRAANENELANIEKNIAIIDKEISNNSSNDQEENDKLIEKKEKQTKKEVKVIRTSYHTITAYNSDVSQCDASPCITANGFNVCRHGEEDTIAANFLKFGTKVRIPDYFGDRIFVVRDRMSKKNPNKIDVWMLEKNNAIKFGVKYAKIEVIE